MRTTRDGNSLLYHAAEDVARRRRVSSFGPDQPDDGLKAGGGGQCGGQRQYPIVGGLKEDELIVITRMSSKWIEILGIHGTLKATGMLP